MKSAVESRTRFVDPIVVTLAMWTFVFAGTSMAGLDPLEPIFQLFLVFGIATHVAGMGVRRWLMPVRARRVGECLRTPRAHWHRWGKAHRLGHRASIALLIILAIGVLFFLYEYAQALPSFDTVGLLAMRNLYLEETRGERPKLFIYTTHLTLFGITVMYYAARNTVWAKYSGQLTNRRIFNLISLVALLASLLTTGRTAPLLVIVCYAYYSLRFGLYSPRRVIGSFVVLSLTMFFLVALALGKEGLGDNDALSAIANIGKIYFFSAPAALQQVVMHGAHVDSACSNIFSYPIDVAKKFGLFANCDARELDFVFVPVATNVFTFLRAYWEDFGWTFGVGLFVAGFLIESVYRAAVQSDGFGTFFYGFILNSLLLQIFEEQLFTNGSVAVYLLFFFLLLAPVFREPIDRRIRRTSSPPAALSAATATTA